MSEIDRFGERRGPGTFAQSETLIQMSENFLKIVATDATGCFNKKQNVP